MLLKMLRDNYRKIKLLIDVRNAMQQIISEKEISNLVKKLLACYFSNFDATLDLFSVLCINIEILIFSKQLLMLHSNRGPILPKCDAHCQKLNIFLSMLTSIESVIL